jgi:hypothetical protein
MTREELIEVIRNELWRQVFARDAEVCHARRQPLRSTRRLT